MKITVPIAAVALATALVLTGCSTGSLPGSSSGSGSGSSSKSGGSGGGSSGSGSSGSGPTLNLTDNDLVAILTKVQASRNLGGTIETGAELKAKAGSNPSESLTQSFAAAGGSFVPASCGTLFDKLESVAESANNATGFTSAALEGTSDIVSVGTATNSTLADSILSNTKSIMSQMVSQCSNLVMKVGTTSIGFKITDVSATTDGTSTTAFEEDITASTENIKTLTIQAQYGNLYIGDVSITNPNESEMEANINAVIAAAKG